MINVFLVIFGLVSIFGGILYSIKYFHSSKDEKLELNILLIALQFLFVFAYLLFLYELITRQRLVEFMSEERLFSFVFFLGGVFVFLTVSNHYKTNIILKKKERKLNTLLKHVEKMKQHSEEEVKNRTKQLEKMNSFMTGRELKMIELKKKISVSKSDQLS
ncbi:MAG: hypothetical protein ABII02_04435 [Candidatus Magasanikbacteria bacterium]